jgi:predicted nucleic acid-binding protein
MTSVHLDTCFLIRALVAGSPEDASLREWLAQRLPVRMSLVAWAEFLCGPVSQEELALARLIVGPPVTMAEVEARVAAELFNLSGRRRGVFVDCLVAASAIREGAELATTNAKDFRGFGEAGLKLAAGIALGAA